MHRLLKLSKDPLICTEGNRQLVITALVHFIKLLPVVGTLFVRSVLNTENAFAFLTPVGPLSDFILQWNWSRPVLLTFCPALNNACPATAPAYVCCWPLFFQKYAMHIFMSHVGKFHKQRLSAIVTNRSKAQWPQTIARHNSHKQKLGAMATDNS